MYLHRTALLTIIGFYLAGPLLLDWWLQADSHWYRSFIIWLVLIALSWLIDMRRGHQDV
jgi:hypothetical protein